MGKDMTADTSDTTPKTPPRFSTAGNAAALFDAVKAHHPKAKRRDITRAALATMIASADKTPDLAVQLQGLAISQRGLDGDD